MPDTHPATLAETMTQTRGKWMLLVGTVIVAATVTICALWHLLHGDDLPLGISLPLFGTGFGAILMGVMERLYRPTRANHQRVIDYVAACEVQFKALEDTIANLPGYGQGVIDGVRMRHEVVGGSSDRM